MLKPTKRVCDEKTLAYFISSSPAYKLLIRFIERICVSIKGQIIQPTEPDNPIVHKFDQLLERISDLVEQAPPLPQQMRFGNKAFRMFYESLSSQCDEFLTVAGVLDNDLRGQLRPYLLDSFGNPVRIDYGTGHEAAFLAFVFILLESGHMCWDVSVVLVLFPKYLELVRLITTQYSMEPAGSHGVWGLDDYHFLPFLFGAAQLIGHEEDMYRPCEILQRLTPSSCPQSSMMLEYCVSHIVKTKCRNAPFSEVSPILFDLLRRLDNWTLVCYGLVQMYKTEVLHKKPVMQHFYFSHYLPWSEGSDLE